MPNSPMGLERYDLSMTDDGISYDIFDYIFIYFICIWRKIRGHLEELSMVWGTFCIVFIWVVVIQFYPKSYNFIWVLGLVSEKSCKSSKQDITWSIKDMKIEDQWFIEGLWRQYKLKNIHFKFQGISRQNIPNTPLNVVSCTPHVACGKNYCLLIFQDESVEKV